MRGVTIGIFLLCVAVFATFMAASGINGVLGVGMHANLADDAQNVGDDLGGAKNISRSPGDGLFGMAIFAMQQLASFAMMFGAIEGTLVSWGAPQSLATGIQMIVSTIGGLMLIWIGRGLIGE